MPACCAADDDRARARSQLATSAVGLGDDVLETDDPLAWAAFLIDVFP